MKKHMISKLASAVLIAGSIALVGCSSSGDSGGVDTSISSSIGTGYYIDNAVTGVDYVCGNQSGVTGVDGNFTFEVGKDCAFSLADVMLRKVTAANLVNDAKIVENNITVATLLQSIDADGDLNNGIQIPSDVRESLAGIFKTENIKGVPSGNILATVMSRLEQNVANFKGFIKTEAQAQEHVKNTQYGVVKEMLAGKKFYAVTEPSGTFLGTGVVTGDTGYIVPFNFNSDVTMINGDTPIKLEGNKLTYTSDPTNYQIIEGKTLKYIKVQMVYVAASGTIGHMRFYFNQKDAQAYIDTFSSASTGETTGGITGETTGGTTGTTTGGITGETTGGGNSGLSTCISLNALSTPSTIVSKDGSHNLSVTLGASSATVQYTTVASGDLVWQSMNYDYVVTGNNITFTRKSDIGSQALDEGMNPPGAVIPESVSIAFSNNVVREGVHATYDGSEYTVFSAFDNSFKMTCN